MRDIYYSTTAHTATVILVKVQLIERRAACALTLLGHDVELAEVLLALGIDELEGVDAVALHVGPVGRDAIVVQQPRQLQARATRSASAHPHMVHNTKGTGTTAMCACSGLSVGAAADRRVRGKADQDSMHGVKTAEAPHNVDGLGVVGEEVQDAPALLDVGLGVGPQGVHQVHKLDPVPDEEHLRSAPHAVRPVNARPL